VGLFWVPRHSGVCGNETAGKRLAREGTVHPVCWTGTCLAGL